MALLVISYSRVDQLQVRALVALLQTAVKGIDKAVYWDGDFEAGDPWFEQMKQFIDAAPQLFVFWCAHAATSAQVRKEFMYALDQKKRVVPVLIDDTRLVPELAEIHGIDLRGAVRHPEMPVSDSFDLPRPVPLPMDARVRSFRLTRWWITAFLSLLLGAVLAFAIYTSRSETDSVDGPITGVGSEEPSPGVSGPSAGFSGVVVIVIAVLVCLALLWFQLRARRRRLGRKISPYWASVLEDRYQVISEFSKYFP
jgi:TIR domain